MDDMKSKVLQKALGMLAVLNCKYAVVDTDGVKYGELEIVEPKGPRTRKASGINYHALYYPILKDVQPSDTIVEIQIPKGIDKESMRGAICAWCTQHWGKDTYQSQTVGDKVHIMRYA